MTLKDTIEDLNGKIGELDAQENDDMTRRRDLLKAMQEAGAVDIPFIVIAMNKDEAQEFIENKAEVFDYNLNSDLSPKQTQEFQKFKKIFDEEFASQDAIDAWLKHYKENREEWVPHLYQVSPESGNEIKTLIERATVQHYERIQKVSSKPGSPYTVNARRFFWPDFVEIEDGFFSKSPDERIDAWQQLYGCSVIVIDSFSLLHPFIRKVLKASPLYANMKYVAAMIVSPKSIEAQPHSLEKLLETEICEEMRTAFTRFDQYFDRLYEFDINTKRRLHRWLFTCISELVPSEPKVHRGNQLPGQPHGINPRGPY